MVPFPNLQKKRSFVIENLKKKGDQKWIYFEHCTMTRLTTLASGRNKSYAENEKIA